jgi:hypothetical protein
MGGYGVSVPPPMYLVPRWCLALGKSEKLCLVGVMVIYELMGHSKQPAN